MSQVLFVDPFAGLRGGGNGVGKTVKVQAGAAEPRGQIIATPVQSPCPDLVRSIRGKYAYLGISVEDFMREKRRDAECGY